MKNFAREVMELFTMGGAIIQKKMLRKPPVLLPAGIQYPVVNLYSDVFNTTMAVKFLRLHR